MQKHDVIVIGAGLAGLSCATKLAAQGKDVLILEATDRVGGRVRTDVVDGFVLDHGFQVLLTAYPACRELLDYKALQLRPFEPGALVRYQGKFSLLGDPWRRPSQALSTAFSPVGSFGDKLRIAKLRSQSQSGSLDRIYQRPAQPTSARLSEAGFTDSFVDQFFRPFLGGVFLDESLSVSDRMLEFVFRMFATGDIAVPAKGMAEIPKQLAAGLPEKSIRLSSTVDSISETSVRLTDGSEHVADKIVVATESNGAARLLGKEELSTQWRTTTNVYYAADQSPDDRKLLMLRGDANGPVQTAVVMSDIAPEYAPAGRSLISVSVSEQTETDDIESLDHSLRQELSAWFDQDAKQWRRLGIYDVPYALPVCKNKEVLSPVAGTKLGLADTIFVCGDHRETPSIQGAMNSGLRAAESILAD